MSVYDEYPTGITVDGGRYRLDSLLRGSLHQGLWRASRLSSEPGTVLVTFRHLRYKPRLAALLCFSAPGIPAPLYLGVPDAFGDDGSEVQQEHFCVVDEQPSGIDLASAGRLTLEEAAALGISLCDVISGWASALDGTVTRGLRPETIFVTGSAGKRRFSGATPRPFFLLGNDDMISPYPRLSFDPPAASTFEFSVSDALFTVAMILWYAFTGTHPYLTPGTDLERNIWTDHRVPFVGPQVLGDVLESSLIAEPDSRVSIDVFRTRLVDIVRERA
jgi:hypothetical protein